MSEYDQEIPKITHYIPTHIIVRKGHRTKTVTSLFWLYLLIVLSGDIEINPGPESVDLSSSCSSCTIDINLSLFEQNFSLVHYDVQSLLAKVDQLQMELSHFDVIALSETWLSTDIKDDKVFFQN